MAQPTLTQFISSLAHPESILFAQTMAVVEEYYHYTPTAFSNGLQNNAAGENGGSCKLFAFARLQQLDQQQTLLLFGQYYRDVLASPDGSDHQNIRQFMLHGWNGITFSSTALVLKA